MIVVDASVLANAVGEDGTDGQVVREVVLRAGDLAAPDLVDVETVAVLRKRWLGGHLSDRRFEEAVEDLLDLPIVRYPVASFMRRAFELRANVTPYDATYVALAEGLGCPLVTRDRRLAKATGVACEISLIGSR